jgi:hypothetical protein
MFDPSIFENYKQNLKLKQFNHYFSTIQQIKSTLFDNKNVLKNEFTTTIFSGHSGCGKSTIVKLIFDNNLYDILLIAAGSYSNIMDLKNKIKNFCTFDSVISCFFIKKKKLIIFDDIDINLNNDRYFATFLKELLKNKKEDLGFVVHCPIVCVVNSSTKKIQDIKVLFHNSFSFKKLSFNQCFQIIDEYITHITSSHEDAFIDYIKLTKLIKDNDNDLRTIFNHLHIIFDDDDIDLTISLKKKDAFIETSPFELTQLLLGKNALNDECIKQMIVRDTNQILSSVHENYYKSLERKSKHVDIKELNIVSHMSKIFLEHELMTSTMFEYNDPFLWDMSLYSKLKSINLVLRDNDNNSSPKSLDFSQMVNKQSLALNFNKKIVKMEQNMNINKYVCLFPFMYIYCVLGNMDSENICKLITKNEFEIIQRFISDFMPSKKKAFTKVKTSLMK